MFKVTIDTDAMKLANDLEKYQLDVEKYIKWYLSKVYQALSKQHTRRWTYVTPPGDKRTNVYMRTGTLRKDLSEARFIKKVGTDTWEAGFDIRPGSYLSIHAGERGDAPVTIRATGSSSLFLGRMAIPLRAALNQNGSAKTLTPRAMNNLLILPFHVLLSGSFGNNHVKGYKPINDRKMLNDFKRGKVKVDFSGEDTKKFHANSLIVMKRSGRRLIPLYVLAKEVKIPKRIFIGEKMLDYYDDLYNKLNDAIEAAAKGI